MLCRFWCVVCCWCPLLFFLKILWLQLMQLLIYQLREPVIEITSWNLIDFSLCVYAILNRFFQIALISFVCVYIYLMTKFLIDKSLSFKLLQKSTTIESPKVRITCYYQNCQKYVGELWQAVACIPWVSSNAKYLW